MVGFCVLVETIDGGRGGTIILRKLDAAQRIFVGKVNAILDSRQIHGRGKQCKVLIHGYSPYKYEWINGVNLPHARALMKAFEACKVAEAQAAAYAKANKPVRRQLQLERNYRLLLKTII